MTLTTLTCPRCHKPGLEFTDVVYCPHCRRRFKLPVLPREIPITRKVGSITFDYGDGTEKVEELTVDEKVSMFGEEWR